MSAPHYVKPQLVAGNKLNFRDAKPDDAAFILSLRTDEKKSRYLSATSPDVAQQRAWLERYAPDDSQVYFLITSTEGKPVGTVRLYDQRGDSFCWGSWIKSDEAPSGFGIESALMVYEYGLALGFKRAHFEVRKGNSGVTAFHERFGAVVVSEDEENFYYEMSEAAIRNALAQYRRYLPDGIAITY